MPRDRGRAGLKLVEQECQQEVGIGRRSSRLSLPGEVGLDDPVVGESPGDRRTSSNRGRAVRQGSSRVEVAPVDARVVAGALERALADGADSQCPKRRDRLLTPVDGLPRWVSREPGTRSGQDRDRMRLPVGRAHVPREVRQPAAPAPRNRPIAPASGMSA